MSMNTRRVAITGTAQTWSLTPWTDPSLEIFSVNDAYRIPGFIRADAWFDLHPVKSWFFSDQPVYAHQIPPGHYARPNGHMEWLAAQQIPVYLHPDYATDCPAMAEWPHAKSFPKAAIEAHFGRYFTSSPAWIMAQAILDGVREIHVYGIHLATEFEYMKQRPNFEFLMGCLLGAGKRTTTVRNELRYYESQDGLLVLPEASPVLQENFQYAFESRPDGHLAPLQWEIHKTQIKRQRVAQALIDAKWWQPFVKIQEPVAQGAPLRVTVKRRSALRDDLHRLDALSTDWQEQLGRQTAEMAHHG